MSPCLPVVAKPTWGGFTTSQSSPTILFIDVELDHQRVVDLLCSGRGWIMKTAKPEEAVSRAAELKPDLILLGVTPIGLDGLHELRADPRTQKYPFIVLSTHHWSKVVANKLEGVAAVMKPFDPLKLAELMASAMGSRLSGSP